MEKQNDTYLKITHGKYDLHNILKWNNTMGMVKGNKRNMSIIRTFTNKLFRREKVKFYYNN